MQEKTKELRELLAKELVDNSMNSLETTDYIDGVAGMNLITIIQMLLQWSIEAGKNHTDVHEYIDKHYAYNIELCSIMHNTVNDFYL